MLVSGFYMKPGTVKSPVPGSTWTLFRFRCLAVFPYLSVSCLLYTVPCRSGLGFHIPGVFPGGLGACRFGIWLVLRSIRLHRHRL